jgi:hypothetical protein
MLIITVLRRPRQENGEVGVNLGYIVSYNSVSKMKQNKTKNPETYPTLGFFP